MMYVCNKLLLFHKLSVENYQLISKLLRAFVMWSISPSSFSKHMIPRSYCTVTTREALLNDILLVSTLCKAIFVQLTH